MNDPANSQKQFERLVDDKIKKEKLDLYEGRLKLFMWVLLFSLAIFGVALPVWQSQNAGNRIERSIDRGEEAIEKAISEIESRFNALAGRQLLKPDITCYIDGNDLNNNIVHLKGDIIKEKEIIVKNSGDGTAEFIKMRLYIDSSHDIFGRLIRIGPRDRFKERLDLNDDHNYKWHYIYELYPLPFPAKDTIKIKIQFSVRAPKEEVEARALLKVFCGEPEPKEIPFTIKLSPKN